MKLQRILVIALLPFVAGCLKVDTDLTFYDDKTVDGKVECVVRSQFAEQLKPQLDRMAESMKSIEGVQVSTRVLPEGDLEYSATLNKSPWTEVIKVENGDSVKDNGDGTFTLTYIEEIGFYQSQFTVRVGEVIATNGNEIEPGVIRWNEQGRHTATFRPRNRSPFSSPRVWIFGAVAGLALLGVALYMRRRGNVALAARTAIIPPYAKDSAVAAPICVGCGNTLSAEATFCPKCGTRR